MLCSSWKQLLGGKLSFLCSSNLCRAEVTLQAIPSQQDGADTMAEEVMAEEEQDKAKPAAKRAKKQKQKARKSQLPAHVNSQSPAAPAAAEEFPLDIVLSQDSSSLHLEDLSITSDADAESAKFLEDLFCCPLTKVSFPNLRCTCT